VEQAAVGGHGLEHSLEELHVNKILIYTILHWGDKPESRVDKSRYAGNGLSVAEIIIRFTLRSFLFYSLTTIFLTIINN